MQKKEQNHETPDLNHIDLLSRMDHDANISPWLLLAEDLQLKIRWLPFNLDTYEFNLEALDEILTERTKLVCIGGASNLTGTINDVVEAARIVEVAHQAATE